MSETYRGSGTPGAGSVIEIAAADITYAPYGDIASLTMQEAINELDDEKVSLAGDTMTGDLTVPNLVTAGNVDGRDVSVDGTKLDGIEAAATADQTGAEIASLLSSETIGTFTSTGIDDNATSNQITITDSVTTFGGNVSLGDSKEVILGADTDLRIFHTGTLGEIINNTGNLSIENLTHSGLVSIYTDDSVGTQVEVAVFGGATPSASLYYGGSKVFETKSSGIDLMSFSSAGASAGIRTGTYQMAHSTNVTTSVNVNEYYNPNGLVGSISISASATAYNTTSDKRLKTTHGLVKDASITLNSIEVHDYHFNTDESLEFQGVMAQDLYEIYPNAVTKPDNEEGVWAVDYSKLVPLMLANIQELNEKVKEL